MFFDCTFDPKFETSSHMAFDLAFRQNGLLQYLVNQSGVRHQLPTTTDELPAFGCAVNEHWCVNAPYHGETATILSNALTMDILARLPEHNAGLKVRDTLMDLKFKVVTMGLRNDEFQMLNARNVTADMMPSFIYDPRASLEFIGPKSPGLAITPMMIQFAIKQMMPYIGVFVEGRGRADHMLYLVNNIPVKLTQGINKEVAEKPYETLLTTLSNCKEKNESLYTLFEMALRLRDETPWR